MKMSDAKKVRNLTVTFRFEVKKCSHLSCLVSLILY